MGNNETGHSEGIEFQPRFQACVSRMLGAWPYCSVLDGLSMEVSPFSPPGDSIECALTTKTKRTALKAWIIACDVQAFQIQREPWKQPFRGLA